MATAQNDDATELTGEEADEAEVVTLTMKELFALLVNARTTQEHNNIAKRLASKLA